MEKVFPILSVITGAYWVVYGFIYGFWIRKGPGGGFFPVIAGILAVIFGAAILIENRKKESTNKFTWKAFLPIGAVILLLICSYILGLVISIAIYIFVWLRFMEKREIKSSIITGVSCSAVIYLVFVFWLSVPLPSGLLGLL